MRNIGKNIKKQRQIAEELYNAAKKLALVYLCSHDDSDGVTYATKGKTLAKRNSQIEKGWGIVISGPGTIFHDAGDIARMYDLIGDIPEGISHVLCISSEDIEEAPSEFEARFKEVGGKILYDGANVVTCFPICDMSVFKYSSFNVLHYTGPVKGRLQETLCGEAQEEAFYEAMDDVACIYVDCGMDSSPDIVPEVTKWLSYGRIDVFEIGPEETPYYEVPAEIDQWTNSSYKAALTEAKQALSKAAAVAQLWSGYATKYSILFDGWGDEAYKKWAELGQVLGADEALKLHFDHGVPVRDILA